MQPLKSVLAVSFLALLLPGLGCNTVGPKAVRGARVNYSSALSYSWNQQMLLNIVRLRYSEAPLFLEVGSLSTQYNLEMGAKLEPLWERPDQVIKNRGISGGGLSATRETAPGSGDEYAHGVNLGYYERPTVTYSLLQGQDYVTQILSPIPIVTIGLLNRSGWNIDYVLALCVQQMNGLDNASTASGPTPANAPEYRQFAEAMKLAQELRLAGSLSVNFIFNKDQSAATLQFSESTPQTDELKRMLGLPQAESSFPLNDAWNRSAGGELSFRTRSFLGVLFFLSNAVEVPEAHRNDGWVVTTRTPEGGAFDWSEVLRAQLKIRSSKTLPADPFIAVEYEGYWFYIEKSDVTSKNTFGLLRTLYSLQSGEVEQVQPTLTIPVGN
jgi:hypothetical protein